MSILEQFNKQHVARVARIEERARLHQQSKQAIKHDKIEPPAAVEIKENVLNEWAERQVEIHPEPISPVHSYPSIERIQRAVCAHYDISMMDILSARRTVNLVRPRQVAFHLCRRLTPRSYPEIGRRFGGRDHTTVMFGDKKITRLVSEDADLKAVVDALIKKLGGEA